VQDRLGEPTSGLAGTQSARAAALDSAGFGPSESVPMLLEGPRAALDRQGPEPVASLRARWSTLSLGKQDVRACGSPRRRPSGLSSSASPTRRATSPEARLRSLQTVLRRHVHAPVHPRLSGSTALGTALTDKTLTPAARLLHPHAAAVPTVVGFTTVTASAGRLSCSANWPGECHWGGSQQWSFQAIEQPP